MFDFTGRIVMITGAAGNLGIATARAFQASGASLVLFDRGTGRLLRLYPELAGSSDHFLVEGINLTEPEAVGQAVQKVIGLYGRVDILVNTAGGYRGGAPLHETPLETWDFLMNLNAKTVLVACRAVIPYMLQQGAGKIVNIAARAALAGGAEISVYSAAKSAVVRLTEGMAAELKGAGLNVNCVLPGTIDTPQNRAERPGTDYNRWVAPEALADVILFLASPAAGAIHGAAIPVYGLS